MLGAAAARIGDSKLARASDLSPRSRGLFLTNMTLPYSPSRGEILICDFDTGFREPEMVKRRPAIVVSHKNSHGRRLCTVVPLSTTAPIPAKSWHYALPHVQIPGWVAKATMWAKCDMLATVSFDRLTKPYKKTQHSGRKYIGVFLCDEDMAAINACLMAYLALQLPHHLNSPA